MKTHLFQKNPVTTASRPHRPAVVPHAVSAAGKTRADIRQILRVSHLQTKLTIGAPDDVYEQEAARVADEVMRMTELQIQTAPTCDSTACRQVEDGTLPTKPLTDQITPLVQRQVEEEEELLQTKALNGTTDFALQRQPEEEEEELLQTEEVAGHTPEVTPRVASKIASMQGGGQLLPASERAFFEPRFGCDFANIRIHSGTQAAAAAASIQARAFAHGRDLVFAAGEYDPQSADGRRLLAHELTHVVQQSGVKGIRGADKPGSSQGRYEYFHLGKVSPEKIYRAEPQPTPSSLPFERVGNEAGIVGAKGAAERLERLVIGTTVARALATIPITDAAQKRIVIQHVQNSPATLRAIAEQNKVRFLSQQEYETGIEFLGFPSGADAFADSKNGFLYITPLGTPSAFTMGHEVSHIQTGPVGGDSADPAFSIALGNLNLEIRAAFVDYAILKIATLHENLAAGMTEEQAVAGFAQVYSSTILDYIVDHGSVESTLGKLAKEVSRRRSVEHVPQNIGELKKAVAKGYVSEADLVLIFSPEAPEMEHYVEPFEIEGL